MPSIYTCYFLGEGWSDWEQSTVLNELPEEFATESLSILVTSDKDEQRCYLYDAESGLLALNHWNNESWGSWSEPVVLPNPPNASSMDEDAYFSVVSRRGGDCLLSINPAEGSVTCLALSSAHEEFVWGHSKSIDPAPNHDESTDVFASSDDQTDWLVAVNLEEENVFFAESNGEDYSLWEEVAALSLPEEWLDSGIDLDSAVVEGQLLLYAIVYDDLEEEMEPSEP